MKETRIGKLQTTQEFKMLKIGKKSPQQERSKTTVEAIFGAVTRILDKEGSVGLTTNKIAEVAGISVGSLYQYFKNKESIFEAILLRMTEKNLDTFERLISQHPEEMGIRDLIKLVVQSQYANIESMGAVSSTLLQYAPQVLSPNHFKKADERIVKFLMEKVSERKIKIRPQDPEVAFYICSQSVRSVIFMSFLHRKKEERQKIVDELIDMLALYMEGTRP